ncbi:hypothetical protein ACH4YO_29155 [Streptomyces noursei]|uniref:hypothetical protein n=1 Tax=Streptomyces noursei TaxID=1971 RepID=UPI0037942E69
MTDQVADASGAPLARPELHTVSLELEREVAADPAEVFDLLVPQLAPDDGHTKFAVYPHCLTAVMQGDWWYRGEYRVTDAPRGARVSYTVVNVAQEQHEAGNLISKGTVAAAPDAFARRLDALEESLRRGEMTLGGWCSHDAGALVDGPVHRSEPAGVQQADHRAAA